MIFPISYVSISWFSINRFLRVWEIVGFRDYHLSPITTLVGHFQWNLISTDVRLENTQRILPDQFIIIITKHLQCFNIFKERRLHGRSGRSKIWINLIRLFCLPNWFFCKILDFIKKKNVIWLTKSFQLTSVNSSLFLLNFVISMIPLYSLLPWNTL